MEQRGVTLTIHADLNSFRWHFHAPVINVYWVLNGRKYHKSTSGVVRVFLPPLFIYGNAVPVAEALAALYVLSPQMGNYLRYLVSDIESQNHLNDVVIEVSSQFSSELVTRKLFDRGEAEQFYRHYQDWRQCFAKTSVVSSTLKQVICRYKDTQKVITEAVIDGYASKVKVKKSWFQKSPNRITKPHFMLVHFNQVSYDNILNMNKQ